MMKKAGWMRAIVELRTPAKYHHLGHTSQSSGSENLAHLSRSASTQPSSSKYGFHGLEKPAQETKGNTMTMLTRGASFRRQGSSGMTWADNWIFTNDGMFLGRNAKVSDEKSRSGPRSTKEPATTSIDSVEYPTELKRSQSVGTGGEKRSHSRWGFKWFKKNIRKAFR